MNRHPERIAIIGGVAAGTAAAAEARRTNPEATVVLFEMGPHISYGACEIPLFLDGTVTDAEKLIAFSPERFALERGVETRILTRVDDIDPPSGRLRFTSLSVGETGEAVFDKFILATGAQPRIPDIEGTDAENVFSIRELNDAIELDKFLSERDFLHVVVVGGGFIGIEVAEALSRRGLRISMLQSPPGPLHTHLEDGMSLRITNLLEGHGIFVREDRLKGFSLSKPGHVNAVHTISGEMIGCQVVILATGISPNTQLGISAGIKTGKTGAFTVDKHMRTNKANVWACGDCVEVESIIDRKPVLSPLSLTAFRTGRIAGRNASRRGTSKPAAFPGVVRAQGIRVFDHEIACIGMTKEKAREAGFTAETATIKHITRAALHPNSESIHITLVFDLVRGRILGAQLIGGEGSVLRGDVLSALIRKGATVFDLYDLDLVYAPPFSPRLDPLLVAARQAIKVVDGSRFEG